MASIISLLGSRLGLLGPCLKLKLRLDPFGMGGIIGPLFGTLVLGAIFWSYMANSIVTAAVLASTLRQSTPLVLGALCGLLGERSGVINIGIEGQMLTGAYVGFMTNVWTGNHPLAVLAGILAGGGLGFLLALMSITLKMNQFIGGMIINILAVGMTGYFYQAAKFLSRMAPIDEFHEYS